MTYQGLNWDLLPIFPIIGSKYKIHYLSFRTLAINWQHIKRRSTSYVMILIYLTQTRYNGVLLIFGLCGKLNSKRVNN
ncbi:MAG: hypothetical protein L0L10_10100, partial [Tetragenococcus sp.]|nr:hypothetical protein [Tetragenococcus sp.]